MSIDLLYLCHGRLEFTQATLPTLIRNTDPDLIEEFVIYNDGSDDDGETAAYLAEFKRICPRAKIRETDFRSPVAVMAHFLDRARSSRFAKIDNDVVVPPGWLEKLSGVLDRNPDLELLGMEPGMGECDPDDSAVHDFRPAQHIGGVGLMRRRAFQRLPRLHPDGRFGFTEWQHQYNPERGWVTPDLSNFCLDLLPVEPWRSLTLGYLKKPGLQREWPLYEEDMHRYWDWWTG